MFTKKRTNRKKGCLHSVTTLHQKVGFLSSLISEPSAQETPLQMPALYPKIVVIIIAIAIIITTTTIHPSNMHLISMQGTGFLHIVHDSERIIKVLHGHTFA